MFEKASRLKLRFDTTRGDLTVEDLWDIPLMNCDFSLDELAKKAYKRVKESEEISFVKPKSQACIIPSLKLDILKRVIEVRLAEIEEGKTLLANKARKDRILAILEEKEDSTLKEKSSDELKALLEEL